MTLENTVGPDQNQASALAAASEAEEHEKAKAELSELLRQIDQTKAEADEARTLINGLGDKAQRATHGFDEYNLDLVQGALEKAHNVVVAALASLDKPTVSAALLTLHKAAQGLRPNGVNVPRIEMKLMELAEFFDVARQIVWEA